jgi:hypothetical protein
MNRKFIRLSICLILALTPFGASAQSITETSLSFQQDLISAYTELVRLLQQEIAALIATNQGKQNTVDTAAAPFVAVNSPIIEPSVTIDQTSLSTHDPLPTITGSATGVSTVGIWIGPLSAPVGSGEISVTNGRWTYAQSNKLYVGMYPVTAFALDSPTGNVVKDALVSQSAATGTLAVTNTDGTTVGPAPSATIDPSSLSAESPGPHQATTITLTGRATNVSSLSIMIVNSTYAGSKDYLSVTSTTTPTHFFVGAYGVVNDGVWAATIPFQLYPGMFTVFVYVTASEQLLTQGNLIID